MKKLKNIMIIIIVIVLMVLVVLAFLRKPNLMPVKGQMAKLDLDVTDKLMIVSHPGDESVWGGVHLLSDNYLVICVSCGYDDKKTASFLKVISYSNDLSVMMGYSDKIYFSKDYRKIKKQFKYILNYKDWKEVAVHNPDGEDNNFQHKQLSKILKDLKVNNLYYFGKYHSEKELDRLDLETKIDKKLIKRKIDMINMYDGLYDEYKHVLPFEDWIGANKWQS